MSEIPPQQPNPSGDPPPVQAGRVEAPDASAAVDVVAADMARRDHLDSSRAASPTTQAPDAVVVDATELTLAEVIQTVLSLVDARSQGQPASGQEHPAGVHGQHTGSQERQARS